MHQGFVISSHSKIQGFVTTELGMNTTKTQQAVYQLHRDYLSKAPHTAITPPRHLYVNTMPAVIIA